MAGDDGVGLRDRGREVLGRLVARLLVDAARERLVVHLLRILEVEGEVVGERHLEEGVAGASLVAELAEEGARLPVVLERLLVGVDRACPVAGLQKVVDGLVGDVRLAEVAGEERVALLRGLAVDLLQRLADALVELLARRLDEARVGDLLDEPVAEAVLGIRAAAHLHDQVEPLQLGERRLELLARHELLEERKPERPSDDCCEREHLPRRRLEPVETGLQRALNERRDRELVLGHGHLPLAVLLHEGAALDEVAERLFQEERVAARPLGEVVGDRLRQLALRGERRERPGRVGRQRPHLDLAGAVRVALPGALAKAPHAVLALGAVEEEERHRRLLRHAQERLDQLEGRLVGPVQVLEDEADGLLLGELADELVEGFEGGGLDALAVQLADALRGIGLQREVQEVGEERVDLLGLLAEELGELGLELQPDARLGRRGADAEPLAQEVPDRPVGERLRVGDRAAFDETDAVAVAASHLPDEPRLADARLAHHRDDRAAALDKAFHDPLEHAQLEVTADDRVCGLGMLHLARTDDLVDAELFGDALELRGLELLDLEAVLDLALGGRADHDAAFRGDVLQARRDVDRVAERVPGIAVAVRLHADDDGARVDSDPYGELDAVGILHLLRVGLHGALDRERSPDGALRVVLVGYRRAEKGEHLVAHELRDCPLVAAHLLRHETHDLVDQELGALGTELLADRGRADDVGDQRRDDAALFSGCYGHG